MCAAYSLAIYEAHGIMLGGRQLDRSERAKEVVEAEKTRRRFNDILGQTTAT